MKVNFALSLSAEGICLLHRAAGGWRVVGEVPLDAPALTQDLAILRKTALELDPSALCSKVILPPDQIKYLTIETGDIADADRRQAALKALDGATPYAVEELAFDICGDGKETHIAAVALETLTEAENFAVEHGFAPLYWVATPGEQRFLGEPFFGATRFSNGFLSEGGEVEPDGVAVVVLSSPASAPEPAPAPPPAPETPDIPEPAAEPQPQVSLALADAAPQTTDAAPSFSSRRKAPALGGVRRQEPVPTALAAADVTAAALTLPDVQDETPDTPPQHRGFQPRRDTPKPPALPEKHYAPLDDLPLEDPPVVATPAAALPEPGSEQARMTIFGARKEPSQRGKPRFLGLILTGLLMIFLAGVAAWAAIFLDDGVTSFLRPEPVQEQATPQDAETQLARKLDTQVVPDLNTDQAGVPTARQPTEESDPPQRVASLQPVEPLPLQARSTPKLPTPATPASDPKIYYAVSGIWSEPPVTPGMLHTDDVETIYLASIDPHAGSIEAGLLPSESGFDTDNALIAPANPQPAGQRYDMDARGLVKPTQDGAITPEGFLVFSGRPPAVPSRLPESRRILEPTVIDRTNLAAYRPRLRPGSIADASVPDTAPQTETTGQEILAINQVTNPDPALAGFRPRLRPQAVPVTVAANPLVAEQIANPNPELAAYRPRLRTGAGPALLAEDPRVNPRPELARFRPQTRPARRIAEKPAPDQIEPAPLTAQQRRLAAARPQARPRNFARIVNRARRNAEPEPTRVVAQVAPRTVKPAVPTGRSVTRQATIKNQLNLNKINLIGVYGKPASRRALVRLANGRFRKVKVGDRIDGGRVSTIGDSVLRYSKGGRNITLKMPKT